MNEWSPIGNGNIFQGMINVVKGDVNSDNKVTLVDASLVLKVALNITNIDSQSKKNADVDNSGKIDLRDAMLVLKASLSIINLQSDY